MWSSRAPTASSCWVVWGFRLERRPESVFCGGVVWLTWPDSWRLFLLRPLLRRPLGGRHASPAPISRQPSSRARLASLMARSSGICLWGKYIASKCRAQRGHTRARPFLPPGAKTWSRLPARRSSCRRNSRESQRLARVGRGADGIALPVGAPFSAFSPFLSNLRRRVSHRLMERPGQSVAFYNGSGSILSGRGAGWEFILHCRVDWS